MTVIFSVYCFKLHDYSVFNECKPHEYIHSYKSNCYAWWGGGVGTVYDMVYGSWSLNAFVFFYN